MWLVRYALAKPYSIGSLALLITFLGFLSYRSLPVDVLPTVNIPAIKIIWTYNGLNTSEMVAKVTSFSELAVMNSVDNVLEVNSQTMNGVAVVFVSFQPSVDIDLALTQITGVSQTILRRMPAGMTPPLVIQYDQSSLPILQLVMSSDTLPEAQLSDFARLQLRGLIQSIPGIRLSLPYGGASRQIMIDLRPDALLAYGLSPADVISAVGRQNLTLPSGTIRESIHDVQISVDASVGKVSDFETLPIRSVDGRLLLLRDVADVRDGPALQTNIARVNGENAVTVSLIKLGNASTLSIIDQVLKKLPGIQKAAPKGLTITPIFNQSIFISSALHHIQSEIIIVGFLVAIVVLLFLGSWRATVIVLISIPLSLLTAIIALKMSGHTLNLMSLGGLALAIGILVDNALVEIENIKRNLALGLTPREAALNSAQQVAFPEFVSTLSTCIVFTPIFLLTGVAGFIFRPLAVVVISALAASYFLSRTIVPVLATLLLPNDSSSPSSAETFLQKIHAKVEASIHIGQLLVARAVSILIRQGMRAVLILAIIVSLGGSTLWLLGRDFFPKTDAGLMRIYIRTEPGNRIEETAIDFAAIQKTIRKVIPKDELELIVDIIGTPDPVNRGWIDSLSLGSYDGEMLIQLLPNHGPIAQYEREIRTTLQKEFPQFSILFQPADITNQTLAGQTPSALDVRFSGKDSAGNYELAQELVQIMKTVPGAADVQIQQVLTLPEYFISIDRDRALQLGVTPQDAVSAILAVLGSSGTVNPNFWADPLSGISYTVQAKTPINEMTSIDDLLNIKLHPPTARADVLLRTIATVTPRLVPDSIGRSTLQPVFNVLINAEGLDLGTLYEKTEKCIQKLQKKLKPGNQIRVMGQADSMLKAYKDLIQGFFLALLFIYLVMVFNFQSWILPIVALFAAPVAISGSLLFLLITMTPLSVQALMGLIMVIGVSTANSVLVTTFARDLWLSGYPAAKAARTATGKRLRPVLMTASTMIIGVIPMALALGQGGEQNAPLARAVIGGLLLGTCASLIFVPWLFARLMRHSVRPVDDFLEMEI